jgi:hypothetical protein
MAFGTMTFRIMTHSILVLSAFILSDVKYRCYLIVMLRRDMLNVILLSVIKLNVVMLSVVAPPFKRLFVSHQQKRFLFT